MKNTIRNMVLCACCLMCWAPATNATVLTFELYGFAEQSGEDLGDYVFSFSLDTTTPEEFPGFYLGAAFDGYAYPLDPSSTGEAYFSPFLGSVDVSDQDMDVYFFNDVFSGVMDFTLISDGEDFGGSLTSLAALILGSSDPGSLFSAAGSVASFQFGGDDVFLDTHQIDVTVSPVPLPAAAWLFLSGLIGLLGLRRVRKVQLAT